MGKLPGNFSADDAVVSFQSLRNVVHQKRNVEGAPVLNVIDDLGRERELVAEAIRRLNIVLASPEQPAGSLSGGNQQKVVISKLLLTRARVLLLYDLTRGVDVGTKGEIFSLMRQLAAEGYAILFFSTDIQELVHVADRVAVMSDGRVSATLEGEAITEEQVIRASIVQGAAA